MTSDPEKPKAKPDPRCVLINLFRHEQVDWIKYKEGLLLSSHPTVYGVDADRGKVFPEEEGQNNIEFIETATQRWLIQHLREHVKQHGTIKELVLSGHGLTGHMGDGEWKNWLNLRPTMRAIAALEKELGCKIADRIIMDGCKTIHELDGEDIGFYRDFAMQHGTQIVGCTSYARANLLGRYACFHPDGSISRDALDKRYDLITLEGEIRNSYDARIKDWTHYYLDVPLQDAQKAIGKDLENYVRKVVQTRTAEVEASMDSPGRTIASQPMQEFLLQRAQSLEALTLGSRMHVSKDLKKAIVAHSDGSIRFFNGIAVSPMIGNDRQAASFIVKEALKVHEKYPDVPISSLLNEGYHPGH